MRYGFAETLEAVLFQQLNDGFSTSLAQSVLRLGKAVANFKIPTEVSYFFFADGTGELCHVCELGFE